MKKENKAGPVRAIKDLWGSFVIAWSMYSKVPMPQVQWTDGRMKYALCFFPLIGLLIGAAAGGFFRLSEGLGAGALWTAFGGTAIPLLITGGIHMDGFLDATDARRSFLPREKKLEILKDPRAGAFAVIGCSVYLLLYAALFSELDRRSLFLFLGTFLTERALSGLSVVSFPMAKEDGLAASFSKAALKKRVRWVMTGYLAASAVYFLAAGRVLFGSFLPGGLCILTAAAVFIWYYRMACREFGGITGDLAGYFLQTCEIFMLAASVLCGWLWNA
ncbi:Cobalamin-5-phosphate synthase [[Clostridium] cf. saccharolyticum K10]|nr:Cobalamin-5-phosphate synthase [[Clostridium] cf. saccharolyticum K10]